MRAAGWCSPAELASLPSCLANMQPRENKGFDLTKSRQNCESLEAGSALSYVGGVKHSEGRCAGEAPAPGLDICFNPHGGGCRSAAGHRLLAAHSSPDSPQHSHPFPTVAGLHVPGRTCLTKEVFDLPLLAPSVYFIYHVPPAKHSV